MLGCQHIRQLKIYFLKRLFVLVSIKKVIKRGLTDLMKMCQKRTEWQLSGLYDHYRLTVENCALIQPSLSTGPGAAYKVAN